LISPAAVLELWQDLTGTISRVALVVTIVFIVVGGIVIMNIMLAAVTERTWEIGMRKAVGAQKADVQWQFLIESACLSTLGGVLGIALAAGFIRLVALLSPVPAELSLSAVATAVAVEGFTEAVDRHVRDITGMAAAAGLSAEVLEGPAHERLWAAVADFPRSREGEALVRLTVPPGAVAAAVDALSRVDDSPVYVAHAGAGTIWIGVEAARAATVFAALTSVAGAQHGHAVLASAPPEVKRGLDVWGSPPPALSIMREIKQRFDPQQLLNPGRFVAFL